VRVRKWVAPILIQAWHVAEGFSNKPTRNSSRGCQGFGHDRNYAGLVARQDLLASEVAATAQVSALTELALTRDMSARAPYSTTLLQSTRALSLALAFAR